MQLLTKVSVQKCLHLSLEKISSEEKTKNFYIQMILRSAGYLRRRLLSDKPRIKIGDVSAELRIPKNPELVPRGYVENLSQDSLKHIRWLLQKDLLGQDAFLIGPPGPRKRWISLAFAELTNREIEYLALSRDITETDIKQRREIVNGTALYSDASAVRAAVNGRILILDGVERVERNVLPVLNNLLENREAQLEDGRFLMAPGRFDQLMKSSTAEELASSGLGKFQFRWRDNSVTVVGKAAFL